MTMRVVFAIALVSLTTGCGKPDPDAWLVKSWEDPVLTLEHSGSLYEVGCSDSTTFHPDGAPPESANKCSLPEKLVGRSVQSYDHKKADLYGKVVQVVDMGTHLELRSYDAKDPQKPWVQEVYAVRSTIGIKKK